MNTRSFIKSLIVGAVAPNIFLPRLENTRWKRSKELIWIPNPAWETAPYEICFGFIDESMYTKFWQDYLNMSVNSPVYIDRITAKEIQCR